MTAGLETALAAGRAAMERGAWREAAARFDEALALEERPEILEERAWVAWWEADEETLFATRERAYRLYSAAGDRPSCVRVAAMIAADHLDFRGQDAIATGWLERARQLSDGVPDGDEHGWILLVEGDLALHARADSRQGLRVATEAVALGRERARGRLRGHRPRAAGHGAARARPCRGRHALLRRGGRGRRRRRLPRPALAGLDALLHRLGLRPRGRLHARGAVGGVHARRVRAARRPALHRHLPCQLGRGAGHARRVGRGRRGALRRRRRPDRVATGLRAARARAARRAARAPGAHRRGAGALRAGAAGRLGDPRPGRASRSTRATRRTRPMPPSACCAASRPARSSSASRRSSCSCGRASRWDSWTAPPTALEQLESYAAGLAMPYIAGRALLVRGELDAAQGDDEAARRAFEDAVDRFAASSAPYDGALARLGLAGVLRSLGTHPLGRDRERGRPAHARGAGRRRRRRRRGAGRTRPRAS